jgi:hypothetical protein
MRLVTSECTLFDSHMYMMCIKFSRLGLDQGGRNEAQAWLQEGLADGMRVVYPSQQVTKNFDPNQNWLASFWYA